jgi:hypothetical protein
MNETPESRKKVAALATVVFVPVIIWFVIGYLMSTQIMELTNLYGLFVAIVLAFLIFLLERTIIMANGNWWIKGFRIFLGLVIAFLGAIFLDEIVFHKDIEHQLAEMQRIDNLQAVEQIDIQFADEISVSRQNLDRLYTDWQNAVDDARKEADGTGGSGQRGVDGIARLKLDAAQNLKVEYDRALSSHESMLTRIEDIKNAIRNNQNISNDGLLIRVKALFSLVLNDWVMALIYGLFTLFLFSMEFLVVMIKMGWRKTNYERKIEMIEEIGRSRMEKLLVHHNNFNPAMNNPEVLKAQSQIMNNGKLSVFN